MLKIYRIVDNTNGNIYIGKTKQTLKERLSAHKSHKNCMSREIIKNGDYKIELIEETDDDTRERYWIENTDCINHNIPGRTKKEWYKEWYENNREEILQYKKEYYENNKDKKKEYQSEYLENNREKIKKYQSEYLEKNKEKFSQYNKEHNKYINSIGGDPRSNNNLLKIDVNLFNLN